MPGARPAKAARARTQRACEPLASEAPYLAFHERIEAADAAAQIRAGALIAKAAETDWRAGAWFLERRDPEAWGPPRLALEHRGAQDAPPINVSGLGLDLSALTDEELKQLQHIATKARPR